MGDTGLSVFYSYSHADETFRSELENHLTILRRSGIVREWHDRMILGGSEWETEIDQNLRRADIILLLISPSFVASEYCWSTEMTVAINRHSDRSAVVIPIVVRPVDFKGAPFSHIQMLPKDARPVSRWPDRDEGWVDVAKGIRKVAEKILQERADPLPSAPERTRDSPSDQEVPKPAEEYLPYGIRSHVLFSWRLSDAFPGLRSILEIAEPTDAADRLAIVLRSPLHQVSAQGGEEVYVPFWWFGRGNSEINRFEPIGPSRVLFGLYELQVKRVVAVRKFSDEWRDFLYLETAADEPSGVYKYSPSKWEKKLSEYPDNSVVEEYAIWRERLITRAEYDDSAAMIEGKPTQVSDAELRKRCLMPSNWIICGKRHVINNVRVDSIIRPIMNGIMVKQYTVHDLVDIVSELPRPDYADDDRIW